jgi:hypothetical protein
MDVPEPRDPVLRLARPLLSAWREPGVLHLGFDGRSFVLKGVPEQLRQAIDLLVEPRTVAELAASLPGLEPAWLDWLCEHLSTAGLLTSSTGRAPTPVQVFGKGHLAAATFAMLRAAGLRPQHFIAGDPLPQGALVVVATATAEPDRTLLNGLAEAGLEHLVVRVEPSRAVVGPFVDPSLGPCVRCDDLARAQLDRGWPMLLVQLCRTEVQPDPGLASWAAATATAQVRSRLAGLPSELAGRSLELGLEDFRLRSRSWPVQPACGYHVEADTSSGTLAG